MISCNNQTVYNDWKILNTNMWHKDSIISFRYDHKNITDKSYRIEIELRNNKDYSFNNLFLKTEIIAPNGSIISSDTLEYNMTDEYGNFLGTGITTIKDNLLLYKEGFKMSQTGIYRFHVSHLMRRMDEVDGIETLQGVNSIGINIKHVK